MLIFIKSAFTTPYIIYSVEILITSFDRFEICCYWKDISRCSGDFLVFLLIRGTGCTLSHLTPSSYYYCTQGPKSANSKKC